MIKLSLEVGPCNPQLACQGMLSLALSDQIFDHVSNLPRLTALMVVWCSARRNFNVQGCSTISYT